MTRLVALVLAIPIMGFTCPEATVVHKGPPFRVTEVTGKCVYPLLLVLPKPTHLPVMVKAKPEKKKRQTVSLCNGSPSECRESRKVCGGRRPFADWRTTNEAGHRGFRCRRAT